MKAMILAAGEGSRMSPLSDGRAKPSLPVLDEPLALRLVRQLAEQGVESVVVNTHHQPDSIRAALNGAPIPVTLSHEVELLGGGGGIRLARDHLRGGPFLVLNGDMSLELDVAELARAHARGGALVTLALRDDPRKRHFGSIGYDERGDVFRVTDRFRRRPEGADGEVGSGLFIGVHVLDQMIFDQMPARDRFDILLDVYLPLLRRGERIHTWSQPRDQPWWPVGSPAELLRANLEALARASELDAAARPLVSHHAHVAGSVEEPAWIGAHARVERGARVGPWVVVGTGTHVRAGTDLERTLLLPGSHPPVAKLRDAIAFDARVWTHA